MNQVNQDSINFLLAWRHSLYPQTKEEISRFRHMVGERAVMRRCASVNDVLLTPAYARLFNKLGETDASVARWRNDERNHQRLAVVVGLLANLKEHESMESLPKQMGRPASAESKVALVNESRFQRILRCGDDEFDRLFEQIRRLLPLLSHKANAYQLIKDLLAWGDPTRQRWARDYYSIAPNPIKEN